MGIRASGGVAIGTPRRCARTAWHAQPEGLPERNGNPARPDSLNLMIRIWSSYRELIGWPISASNCATRRFEALLSLIRRRSWAGVSRGNVTVTFLAGPIV